MRVLSLFDGCGMLYQALKNVGIEVDTYYASEIDKYSIKVAKKNHPDIIEVGDVNTLDLKDFKDIDLLVAGFPCQSFSIAGKRLNFEDDRGQLFFRALEILNTLKPRHFIFENVASMKKEVQKEISRLIGCEPVMINSALLSAQQRKRLYWTNALIMQPDDKKIYLRDVAEDEVDKKYYIKPSAIKVCKDFEAVVGDTVCGALRGRHIIDGERIDFKGAKTQQRLEFRTDNKTNCLTTVFKDNLIMKVPETKNIDRTVRIGTFNTGGQADRVYSTEGKSVALSANGGGRGGKTGLYGIFTRPRGYNKGGFFSEKSPALTKSSWQHNNYLIDNLMIRKLTPIECERLQTLPDNYSRILYTELYALCVQEEIDERGKIICKRKNAEQIETEEDLKTDIEKSVYYLTGDIKNTDLQNYLRDKIKVSSMIENRGKKAKDPETYIIDITKTGYNTEALYTQIRSGIQTEDGSVRKDLTIKLPTGILVGIILKEDIVETALITTLILVKLIIELGLDTLVKHEASIQFCIKSCEYLQGRCIKMGLSDVRMENFIVCSDNQRYKMVGNGFTVAVIEHLLREIGEKRTIIYKDSLNLFD